MTGPSNLANDEIGKGKAHGTHHSCKRCVSRGAKAERADVVAYLNARTGNETSVDDARWLASRIAAGDHIKGAGRTSTHKRADQMMAEPASYEDLQAAYEQMQSTCREALDGWGEERDKLWRLERAARKVLEWRTHGGGLKNDPGAVAALAALSDAVRNEDSADAQPIVPSPEQTKSG